MHIKEQDKDQVILIKHITDNQKRKLICRGPTKAQLILHELISQIPLSWNYENCLHAY